MIFKCEMFGNKQNQTLGNKLKTINLTEKPPMNIF